ncbi:alpha/beta fold hydrolase [Leptospira terpstrae]|uniref:alpha/beta fold hydrolase n=1 Tax=Leptospira terpstrae TaxID=293075 RepID=UPI003D06E5EA
MRTNTHLDWYRIQISFLFLSILSSLFCGSSSSLGGERIYEFRSHSVEGEIYFLSNECKNKKKLLLFIHGSPGSASDFESYLKDKDLQKEFCMCLPDRLGYGNSFPKTSVPNVFLQGKAIHTALLHYLKKEGLFFKEGMVLGHSYGGPVALVFAMEEDPSNSIVWKCLLLSSPIDPSLEELYWYNRLANFGFVQWILPNSWVHSNEEMYTLKSDLERLTSKLGNQTFEIISIHGENDSLVSPKNVYYFTKWKPNLNHRIQILEDENHFIPWTSFQEIKNIILSEGNQ